MSILFCFIPVDNSNSSIKRLKFHNDKPHCDGACGFNMMENILKELGYKLKCVTYNTNLQQYILETI